MQSQASLLLPQPNFNRLQVTYLDLFDEYAAEDTIFDSLLGCGAGVTMAMHAPIPQL